MSSCKRGFLRRLSKQNFLRCFEKCSKSAGACYPRCDCMALVERERKGCDRACDSYPFTSSFDTSHCYKECKFDYEAGQKICEAGTMFLHRDLETTISWSTFLDSFPNLIRVGKTYIQSSSCSFSLTCSEASGVNASEKRALLLQKRNACLHNHADRNCRRIQNCIFINLQWFMCSLSIFVCINLRKNCKLAVYVIEIDATTCQWLSYCSETLRWCILVFNMTTMSGII